MAVRSMLTRLAASGGHVWPPEILPPCLLVRVQLWISDAAGEAFGEQCGSYLLLADSLARHVPCVGVVKLFTAQAADVVDMNRCQSNNGVVGSAWPTLRCLSFSLALVSNVVVMTVARIAWGETPGAHA
jgi:hypothetical protein